MLQRGMLGHYQRPDSHRGQSATAHSYMRPTQTKHGCPPMHALPFPFQTETNTHQRGRNSRLGIAYTLRPPAHFVGVTCLLPAATGPWVVFMLQVRTDARARTCLHRHACCCFSSVCTSQVSHNPLQSTGLQVHLAKRSRQASARR